MRKDEPVNLDVVIKVANALDCDVVDIISILPATASPAPSSEEI